MKKKTFLKPRTIYCTLKQLKEKKPPRLKQKIKRKTPNYRKENNNKQREGVF